MQYDYDILIVGGGLAGNSLALALQTCGLRIALVEAVSKAKTRKAPAGDRALALSAGSVRLLDDLQVWEGIKSRATAIKAIHVSDRGHFGKVRLSSQKERVEALGYVITASTIEGYLATLVEQSNIERICPGRVVKLVSTQDAAQVSLQQGTNKRTVAVRLVVGADGGQSTVRRLLEIPQQTTDYQQTALITTITASLAHHNTAFERFTEAGPLAVLPLDGKQCSIVWTRSKAAADQLMASDESVFLAQLQHCFGYALGSLALTAPRNAFPLKLVHTKNIVSGRAVIIGNAAHQLHPVAGQGFNLGLRDVMQLAQLLIEQHQQQADIGEAELLRRYARSRAKDHRLATHLTDGLVKLFSTNWLPLAAGRGIGLLALDHLPFAKSMLAKYAMGLAEQLPKIGASNGLGRSS